MSFGTMAVDYEVRYDIERLRRERLQRAKDHLKRSGLGALLCFDPWNIRYITSTWLHWTKENLMARYCLLPTNGEPILFENGTTTTSRNLPGRTPWLEGRIFPAISLSRGASPREAKRAEKCVAGIKKILSDNGVLKEPLGVDILDVPLMEALNAENIRIGDGQEVMMEARRIKTQDEIELMDHAAMIMDVAFSKFVDYIRPGVTESGICGLLHDIAYRMGSDEVENAHAISGPRTNPHPHSWSDRTLRPRDLVFFDANVRFLGYSTCYYRTFSVGKPTQEQKDLYKQCYDWLYDCIKAVRPGATTWDVAKKLPTAAELGYSSEEESSCIELGHGIGLGMWERPIITRMYSEEHPVRLEKGMVLALETYTGKVGGNDAVRIEEEGVVTDSGFKILSRYPCDELISCPVSHHGLP
jgi:Xaa-Pro aminopeptidase